MTVFGPKWDNFDSFGAKMGQRIFFCEKAKMSLPYTYDAATLCKKPEQTYERILRSRPDERTDKSEFVGPNSASSGEDQQKYEKYDWKYVIPEIPENVLLEIRWFCDAILGHLLRVGCC